MGEILNMLSNAKPFSCMARIALVNKWLTVKHINVYCLFLSSMLMPQGQRLCVVFLCL